MAYDQDLDTRITIRFPREVRLMIRALRMEMSEAEYIRRAVITAVTNDYQTTGGLRTLLDHDSDALLKQLRDEL